ncbi:CLUMA_CG020004, isoform A [Clunio marinus]|uniref:Sulfhydryl oxidase n=1 Tax=Clunio marinus TaxID=568069 RepID=A0A1J1J3N9_9DIPT|nr:CLUMA_CG020004, isoform A [Clunio marinus]
MPLIDNKKMELNSPENCRTCVDFKTWTKQQRKALSTSEKKDVKKQEQTEPPRRDDCPWDKDALGRSTWGLLHTMAATFPNEPSSQQQNDIKGFFHILSRLYPCEYCAKDFRKELKEHPPQVKSQQELSQWLCKLHNKVNVKIGKPEFDCSKVNERWRDGWLDGSCD